MQTDFLIELTMVKHGFDKLPERLERFGRRFQQVVAAGQTVSLPDNPMGNLSFQGHELIEELKLETPPDRVMIHLNTFHTLAHLHEILYSCGNRGIRHLLIVSGDGSARLPRLRPTELGHSGETVTSVELIAYIRREFGNFFRLGAAYNQYEPAEHEDAKLNAKLEAGAAFIVTQPVLRPDPRVDRLIATSPVPVYPEAWMSPRVALLAECVGCPVPNAETFDPVAALQRLRDHYRGNSFYLAVINFERQFPAIATHTVPPAGCTNNVAQEFIHP